MFWYVNIWIYTATVYNQVFFKRFTFTFKAVIFGKYVFLFHEDNEDTDIRKYCGVCNS